MPRDTDPPASAPDAPDAATALAQRAEAALRQAVDSPPRAVHSADEVHEIVHQLRVHEIELEMQNEELRSAQRELDASRERYFDLYDLAPVGYCTLDEGGQITQANLTAAMLLGVSRSAMVGRAFNGFILSDDQDIYYLHCKRLARSRDAQRCEVRMWSQDGTPFWAQLVATILEDNQGRPVHRVILNDVSDRVRLESALKAKIGELEQRLANAEAAAPAKTGLHTASSPESGEASGEVGPISLADTLRDCRAMVEAEARAATIQVDFRVPGAQCLVRADSSRLKQVMHWLVSNAIKHERPGGSVQVTCDLTVGPRVRITVGDSGEGVPPEKLDEIFEPLRRPGEDSAARSGTGGGLATCRRLIRSMGGELGAQSTVGVGSVFWIELERVAWWH